LKGVLSRNQSHRAFDFARFFFASILVLIQSGAWIPPRIRALSGGSGRSFRRLSPAEQFPPRTRRRSSDITKRARRDPTRSASSCWPQSARSWSRRESFFSSLTIGTTSAGQFAALSPFYRCSLRRRCRSSSWFGVTNQSRGANAQPFLMSRPSGLRFRSSVRRIKFTDRSRISFSSGCS